MNDTAEILKNVPIEDLINAVNAKSDFFIGLSMTINTEGKMMMSWRFKGDHDFCSGLCEALKIKINDHKKEKRL